MRLVLGLGVYGLAVYACSAERVLGPVSTRNNRVLKGPLGRSLRSFARTAHSAHSAHSLRSAPSCSALLRSLCSLAPFMGSLTHFAHSLVGQLKFMKMCSR